jgi:endonuclease III related protein
MSLERTPNDVFRHFEIFIGPRYMHFGKISYGIPGPRSVATRPDRRREGASKLSQSKSDRRSTATDEEALRTYYLTLARAWGPQHWWPARTRFEVIVGAYLTQNTAWTNVERALAGLRSAQLLSLDGIRRAPLATLERLIRPSGYFRQKAQRLKTFVAFVDRRYGGSLARMFSQPTNKLREELLGLNGIGPETADSILLYAGNHPVFVVDAYTRRILERHQIMEQKTGYDEIRQLFEGALAPIVDSQQNSAPETSADPDSVIRGAAHPPSRMSTAQRSPLVQVYNEMHGLLVGVGKNYCRKSQPLCDGCPLQPFLPCRK